MSGDLMLSEGIEWGDPLPMDPERHLDPELVQLLIVGTSIITPEQIRATVARVDLVNGPSRIAIDGRVVMTVWVAQLIPSEYIRLLVGDDGRVFQVRISRIIEEITYSLPTLVATEVRRQISGDSPYGTDPVQMPTSVSGAFAMVPNVLSASASASMHFANAPAVALAAVTNEQMGEEILRRARELDRAARRDIIGEAVEEEIVEEGDYDTW